MIQSSVTISLVEEARGGPFVFWDDLADGCRKAKALGFDAIELFAPSGDAVDPGEMRRLLHQHGLKLAAVGTGAGWVIRRLSLSDADVAKRQQAKDFVRSLIDFSGPFGAPAIIGSMQGSWGGDLDKVTAIGHLTQALNELGDYAAKYGVPLIYESLNRYETNLVNTIADSVTLLQSLSTSNVKLLADLFHMNIEETNLPEAIRDGEGWIGHVHLADSNRRPAGFGHTDFEPIAAAFREIGYDGYASAEAFPYPNPDAAAEQTIHAFRRLFA